MVFCCSGSPQEATTPPQNKPSQLSVYKAQSDPFFVSKPDGESTIRCAQEGAASDEATESPKKTLIYYLQEAERRRPNQPALKAEVPCPPCPEGQKIPPPTLPEDEWKTWTYAEYLADVKAAAKAFIKYGMAAHESVNIWGFNSPQWMISAHAAFWAGGKCAGIYPTDSADTAAYKILHSGSAILVLEDVNKLSKIQKGLLNVEESQDAAMKALFKAVVYYGAKPKDEPGPFTVTSNLEKTKNGEAVSWTAQVHSWQAMIDHGNSKDLSDDSMLERSKAVQAGHCAAIIYTSGTTGNPKAVMISHDNICFEGHSVLKCVQTANGFNKGGVIKEGAENDEPDQERILSYLPLSHVAGMLLDIVAPVFITARGPNYMTTYFARNYDLKMGSIKDRLKFARPTLFLGVPLVWEKIADKIRAIGASNTGPKKWLGDKAKSICLRDSHSMQLGVDKGKACCSGFQLKYAKALMHKVKEGLGLEAVKVCLTGAAPIRVDTLEYFGSLGMPIMEVYGMSECTGCATFSTPSYHVWGSCGFELQGCEVRVFKDGDTTKECPKAKDTHEKGDMYQGELCYRGRNIMMGYMAQPNFPEVHQKEIKQKNMDAIDENGWLHSGDKGMIIEIETVTGNGQLAHMVKVTGRYKELIIGEGGENIAPVPIEDHVKKVCDGIMEIMMIGNQRKYNVAFVTLKAVGADGEGPGTDQLDAGAKRLNPEVQTISQAMDDKAWIDAITEAITSANNNGVVCANNAAKIQKFTILPFNFSEEGNELTPTKKLKRSVVETKFKTMVDKMYASEGVYVKWTT